MKIEKQIMETFHALAEILDQYFSVERHKTASIFSKIGASGNEEIVTTVDKEVEDICIKHLLSVFPEIPVIAEEHYAIGEVLPSDNWVFIIDPIDGTEQFSSGGNEWSVSLSAVKDQKPSVSMIIMPQYKLRLTACLGEGVICNGEALFCSEQEYGVKKIALSPRQIQYPEYLQRIQKCGMEPIPVSTVTIKIVSILLGKVDAAIYFPQEGRSANIWDYAGAILLLEEFGGKMTSLDGSPMPFDSQQIIHRGGWLATSSSCDHNVLLENLQ